MSAVHVSDMRFSPATREESAGGLLGWCSFVLPGYGLRLDSVAVRKTAHGRLTLSYPRRLDASGERHFILRPIDSASRVALERAVLAELGLGGGAP